MNLYALVLKAILSLPHYDADVETPSACLARMETIASAITRTANEATCSDDTHTAIEGCKAIWGNRLELAMLLVTIALHESGLAEHIHADRCGKNECDHGLAKGLWQMHASYVMPREVWEKSGGTSAGGTYLGASYAARRLAGNRTRCAKKGLDWLEPTIAGYATGNVCQWSGTASRAKTFRVLMGGK